MDATVEREIDELLARMTIEEKLGQLAQYRSGWGETGPTITEVQEEDILTGQIGSFLGVHGVDYTRRLQKMAVEGTRLGVPLIFAQDVIHGYRTIFPMPLAEAASWDLELVEHAARIAAIEATAGGIHWTFAPVCDVSRDPRWGRIVEGPGEDPYLASLMTAARVRGFQGDDLKAVDTLLACAKHFAAYGAVEAGRDYNTVDLSERTLRALHLPPFHAAVQAGVETFMASFNEVNGVPAHANRRLMTDILRDQWGFAGFVVSDYTGVMELMKHGVAANDAEAGLLALRAGIDMDMVSGIYANDLPAAVKSGRLEEQIVDAAVRRVLRAKHKVGIMDDPFRYCNAERERTLLLTDEHRTVARKLAAESIVLLKNAEQTLPLSPELGTIAVIGALADYNRAMLGGWALDGRAEDAITILTGIKQAVSPRTKVLFAKGAEAKGNDRSHFQEAIDIVSQADAVVLVVGEDFDMSSEANNRTSIDLPGVQRELAQALQGTGKPLVVVLVNGRPLAVPWLDEHVPAILETWFLGVEAGNAIADVLFGQANPSGKLPVTFPRNVGQIPIYYNHKNTGRPPDPEDKYTSKYLDVHWTPLYPFGHGLSYTTFVYDALRIHADTIRADQRLDVEIDVRNAGGRAGAEVVQLYVRDDVASVTRPVKELRRFARIELEPGESHTVKFTLTPPDLAYYDLDMQYVVEPGEFTLFAGGSSDTALEKNFKVVTDE